MRGEASYVVASHNYAARSRGTKPETALINVVLPAPFGPIMPLILPRSNHAVAASTARTPPKETVTSVSSIAASSPDLRDLSESLWATSDPKIRFPDKVTFLHLLRRARATCAPSVQDVDEIGHVQRGYRVLLDQKNRRTVVGHDTRPS